MLPDQGPLPQSRWPQARLQGQLGPSSSPRLLLAVAALSKLSGFQLFGDSQLLLAEAPVG